ncbi:MAG: dephospho-CoA kinase [Helicobacteraceae bacterium]|jgi:dephospho-CoA kinase|nr:dephospho-CoA kinase [Helicobacteraceae bacterium]
MKNAIVLTGGIATGKSSALKLLKERGFSAIDADEISRERFAERSKEIEAVFGTLNRAEIGDRIFASADLRAKLEAILHPLIRERIFEESAKLEALNRTYFIDIPLFFERQNEYPIERSLLIYAPRQTQIARLTANRGMSNERAIARIASQIPIEEKRKKAWRIIENVKDLAHLSREVDGFLKTAIDEK